MISYREVCAGRRKETSLHRLGATLVVAVVLALMASAWAGLEVRESANDLGQLIDEGIVTLSQMHELASQVEAGARNARTLLDQR